MIKQQGLLIVMSGPSGVGKGTVCKEYLSQNNNIAFSVSVTTRTPRPGERDGVDYFFRSEEEFINMRDNNGFLEHAHVHGKYYGTPRDVIEQRCEEGLDTLLDIDVQGALQVKRAKPDAVLVFLLPPSMQELEHRLRSRGTETEENVLIRLGNATKELSFAKDYDYLIVNDTVKGSVERLSAIITAEHCKADKCEIII